jgi:hypothetical protein
MSLPSIRELKNAARIHETWAALGGGQLRHGRGQAFWRSGDGYSVSLDAAKGLWHDFVTGAGGDVVALVETVRGCGFRDALAWLADFAGVPVPGRVHHHDGEADNDWPTDLKWAMWWKIAAEALAEEALEELPCCHPERRGLTQFLITIRLGDSTLLAEYREWRRREPLMTSAMVKAGRLRDARVQRKLAHWLRRYLDGRQTT